MCVAFFIGFFSLRKVPNEEKEEKEHAATTETSGFLSPRSKGARAISAFFPISTVDKALATFESGKDDIYNIE